MHASRRTATGETVPAAILRLSMAADGCVAAGFADFALIAYHLLRSGAGNDSLLDKSESVLVVDPVDLRSDIRSGS